ncbi:MAG: thioredoxin-dependent thiol peroxidase [Spirochaetales bacterium]|nr:thioredoxin-dependent thiol peroxidase [Spirochaetales bacterium]
MAELNKNDKAPDFKLQDQDGNYISLSDFKGGKVFLYFYPRANTPGCTTQSCNVQEALPDFSGLKVKVLGISPDTPDKQKKFADKYNLHFPLLCDVEKSAAEAYGVWGEKKMYGKVSMGIIRSSFLIDEEGKIQEAWYKVSPKDTVPLVMEILK